MPPPPKPPLHQAIDDAIANFAADLIAIIRQATVAELAGLGDIQPAARKDTVQQQRPVPVIALAPVPVEAPEPSVEDDGVVQIGQGQDTTPVSATEAPAAPETAPAAAPLAAKTTARKKRAWPSCTVEGCGAKMYGPSGPATLCYRHHVEAGGQVSPFARKRKAVSDSARVESPSPEVQAEPRGRKVIRRRKGEELTTGASAIPHAEPEPTENPPLTAKDEGLRRVEARLARKKT